jgi:hypothetical protein
VIGHDDITHHYEAITISNLLEDGQKQIAPLWASQPGLPMITTAGDESAVHSPCNSAGDART